VIVTRAPLRIPIAGGGTDFPSYYKTYGGYIIGFALDKYVYTFLHKTLDSKIRLKYSKNEVVDNPDELENKIAAEALKYFGITSNIEIATFCDVPEGAGLGGSSAFTVALVLALSKITEVKLDKYTLFAAAYEIERNKAGQSGGIQDQFFASFGGSWEVFLNEKFKKSKVDLSNLLPHLSLVYTNKTRTVLEIADTQTSRVDKGDTNMVSNLHKTKEIAYQIRESIQEDNCSKIGGLFDTHFRNKVKRDPRICSSGLLSEYESYLEDGALGGKLIGLGGGGYFLMYDGKGTPVGVDKSGAKVLYEV